MVDFARRRFPKAWYTQAEWKKTKQRSLCTNYPIFVQRSSQLIYCVLTGGQPPPPPRQNTPVSDLSQWVPISRSLPVSHASLTEAGPTAGFCQTSCHIHKPNIGRFLLHQQFTQCVHPLTFRGIGITKSSCTLSLRNCKGNKAIKASDHEAAWCTSSRDRRPERSRKVQRVFQECQYVRATCLSGPVQYNEDLRNALGVCREDTLQEERYISDPGNEPVCCWT